MRAARPAQTLLGRCVASARSAPAVSYNSFHTSTPRSKRKPRFRNVLAEDLGLITPEQRKKYREEKVPDFTEEELKALEAKFTPQQWEALEAGEKAVSPDDIVEQGRLRGDPYRPNYIDDLSEMDPRYDVRPARKITPSDPDVSKTSLQWGRSFIEELTNTSSRKVGDQLTRAMVRAMRTVKASKGGNMLAITSEELDAIEKDPTLIQKYISAPDEPEPDANATGPNILTQAEAQKLDQAIEEAWEKELIKISEGERDEELTETWFEQIQHGPEVEGQEGSVFAPELPKIPGVAGRSKLARREGETPTGGEDPGDWEHMLRITQMPMNELLSLYSKPGIVIRQVANQTRLGKVQSASIMTLVGNGDGMIGVGMAKASVLDQSIAVRQARMKAILALKPIRRYENRTIYGTVIGKVGATTIELSSRPPGRLHS